MRLLPRSRRGTWLLAAAALTIIALVWGSRISSWAFFRAQGVQIERDSQTLWSVDPSVPFIIELARGGGPGGMDSIWIDDTGTVNFHRRIRCNGDPEMGTLLVTNETIREILDAVKDNRLMQLHRVYDAFNVYDGAHWQFRAQQAGRTKIVDCRNYFPAGMTEFADQLDRILNAAGSAGVRWAPEYP